MFGDIIIYDAQMQVILNLKQGSGLRNKFKHSRCYASSGYQMAVKTWRNYIFQMPKGSYFIVSDGIWQKFKLLCMSQLPTRMKKIKRGCCQLQANVCARGTG